MRSRNSSLWGILYLFIILTCSSFTFAASYLTIDPDDYNFLVYNCGTDGHIITAMTTFGITPTYRDDSNPVTANDLATHDILIVSWNSGGDSSGLDPDILYAGITGRIVLTGHDLDYHTGNQDGHTQYAEAMFSQTIDYVLTSSTGTGLIGLADISTLFDWLPSEWGVTAAGNSGENIETFTTEGLDSGVYDGLTPEDLSNWSTSYHNTFTDFTSAFAPFELGGNGGLEIITIANMSPYNIAFNKYDDVNDDPNFVTCVLPEEQINYTICWENNDSETFYNVTVVDYLPIGVDYGSITEPNYSLFDRTYTWDIGTVAPDSSGCVSLDVTVNYNSNPCVPLRNVAHLKSDDSIIAVANVITDVCCWGGDVIYVDDTATGLETGTSWADAYTDLQDALARAAKGCGNQIWVAAGTYSPGNSTTDTFEIPDGIVLYGGLAGNENPDSFDPNSRETIQYKSILTGLNDSGKNDRVVTMGQDTKLHGFIVEDGRTYNVYGTNCNFSLEKCIIQNNEDIGVYSSGGNMTVNWCIIKNNANDGIYSYSYNKKVKVNNCKIYDNGENGIYAYYTIVSIKNSEIHHNGWDKHDIYDNGINLVSPSAAGAICNCTIFRNEGHGVYFSGISAKKPDIRNCIFYNNNYHDDLTQFYGGLTAHYCSVTDPADPNSTDCTKYGDNNMKCDPEFAYININDHNLHLAADSACIDAGDETVVGSTEVDIDADSRIDDTDVDMGADEVSCTDEIANSLDFNGDGLVNNNEFALFSKAWLQYDPDEYTGTDPNDTINWDPRCNLDDTGDSQYVIDLADLVVFAESWCWQACWKDLEKGFSMMAMGSGSGMMSMESVSSEILTAPQLELTIEEQIDQTEYLLGWLNDLWKTDEAVRDTIDKDQWKDFIDSIEAWLDELKEKL